MEYEPPFERTPEIDDLCMEIAELVGMLHTASGLGTSPTLHRELRIRTIRSSLMIEGNTLSEEAVTAIMDGKRVPIQSHPPTERHPALRPGLPESAGPSHARTHLRV